MVLTIVISLITILAILITSIVKPSIKIKGFSLNLYWLIAIFGALLILICGSLKFEELFKGLTSKTSINPLQILLLFISMSLISIFLDECGFFSFLANFVLSKCKKSQLIIFTSFYFLAAFLTMFTSNDIVILTLTPFIINFCKRANISAIPYLIGEFMAANTWSMMFIIGNPTNIYLCLSNNIDFISYLKVMWLPTLLAGLVEFGLLLLVFNKKIKQEMSIDFESLNLKFSNKELSIIGLIILGICTVFLVISSYIDIPMYLISFVSLVTLIIVISIFYLFKKQKPKELISAIKRTPIELVPFVIGMFTLVLALKKYEVTNSIGNFLGTTYPNLTYGFSSLISANLLNNIPMSVIYSSIISSIDSSIQIRATYAAVIGSNIGAFLTPLGALAGLMWMNILKTHNVKYTYLEFIKYGFVIGIPVALISFLLI